MRNKYITIEREYGSGGTRIARLLSEKSGIPCYGYEILEQVSKDLEISIEQINRYEETATNSFLYSIFMLNQLQSGNANMVSNEGHIFLAEQKVIRQLAAEGPAIFLGHCAEEALKEHKGVVRVFIHSDIKEKRERVMEDYGIPEKDVESMMKKFDKKRSNYFFANTGRKWNDLSKYDIVLDSGKLGNDGCVNALFGLLKK